MRERKLTNTVESSKERSRVKGAGCLDTYLWNHERVMACVKLPSMFENPRSWWMGFKTQAKRESTAEAINERRRERAGRVWTSNNSNYKLEAIQNLWERTEVSSQIRARVWTFIDSNKKKKHSQTLREHESCRERTRVAESTSFRVSCHMRARDWTFVNSRLCFHYSWREWNLVYEDIYFCKKASHFPYTLNFWRFLSKKSLSGINKLPKNGKFIAFFITTTEARSSWRGSWRVADTLQDVKNRLFSLFSSIYRGVWSTTNGRAVYTSFSGCTTWDVASGTNVKEKHYQSSQGEIEHAVKERMTSRLKEYSQLRGLISGKQNN